MAERFIGGILFGLFVIIVGLVVTIFTVLVRAFTCGPGEADPFSEDPSSRDSEAGCGVKWIKERTTMIIALGKDVEYDLFRRIISALLGSGQYDAQKAVAEADNITLAAIKKLKARKIISE